MDKMIKYVAIAFLVFFVITAPNSAAGIVHRALGWLHSWGDGVSEFVSNTVG